MGARSVFEPSAPVGGHRLSLETWLGGSEIERRDLLGGLERLMAHHVYGARAERNPVRQIYLQAVRLQSCN